MEKDPLLFFPQLFSAFHYKDWRATTPLGAKMFSPSINIF